MKIVRYSFVNKNFLTSFPVNSYQLLKLVRTFLCFEHRNFTSKFSFNLVETFC